VLLCVKVMIILVVFWGVERWGGRGGGGGGGGGGGYGGDF